MSDWRDIVSYTAEFRRVAELPRSIEREPDVENLTDALRTPKGTMTLRPLQALALEELHACRGLLGALPVGVGKTLITFLAGAIFEAKRPLLLIPANLHDKTVRDFDELAKHWNAEPPKIVSYSWLSRAGQAEWLNEYAPDLVGADEAHKLKNDQAACTRRVFRYLLEHREVPFYALTGTLWGRSIMDMHKLSALTLGAENMPFPQGPKECRVWAAAVDEKVSIRARPGALEMFLLDGEPPSVPNVRAGLGRRIFETPGVVASETVECGASLCIRLQHRKIPAECVEHVQKLLDEELAPNGDICTPSDVARHLKSLALGFFYEWHPAPPWEWLDARRHWKRFASDILAANDGVFDSELQVWNACKRGDLSQHAWVPWAKIKKTYTGKSVARWISDDTLNDIVATVGNTPTIVWVEQVAVGQYLHDMTDWPYYREQGRDKNGRLIDDHDPTAGPAIASIASNHEGRNLQHWSRALVTSPPANGKIWEQMIGRIHRPGQSADTVEFDVWIQHPRIRAQFRQAIRDARMHNEMTTQPRKLLLADYPEEV